MKDDLVYVDHILQALARIEENTAGGMDVFLASHTLQDAVLRNLQTLAESTQRLSEKNRALYPAIDWRAIRAFRNILVHDYLGIDSVLVWRIVVENLPELKAAMLDLALRLSGR